MLVHSYLSTTKYNYIYVFKKSFLVPKQSSMYNISTMSDKSDRHLYHKYETLNLAKMGTGGGISGGGINHSPPLSRATSPLNHDYDNGLKVWHLVRHEVCILNPI